MFEARLEYKKPIINPQGILQRGYNHFVHFWNNGVGYLIEEAREEAERVYWENAPKQLPPLNLNLPSTPKNPNIQGIYGVLIEDSKKLLTDPATRRAALKTIREVRMRGKESLDDVVHA